MSALVYVVGIGLAFSPFIAAGIITSEKDLTTGATIVLLVAALFLMVAGGAMYSGFKGGGSKLGIGGGALLGIICLIVFVTVWYTAD